MSQNSIHRRGLYLGVLPERAAARNGSMPLTLDHDLDVLPETGRRLTVAELARHVDDLAGRLSAAGVRPGERIVIHKAANVDVWVLGVAAARVGATPVMLSHFFQIYGQSEVGPAVGRPYFRRSVRRMDGRCVGYPLPGSAKVRVVSQNGKRASEKNPGFIEARWDGIAKTYFGEQERYDANLHDGWWRTGDVGYRSKLGCLHMLDREVDTISGVSSNLEVEDLLLNRLEELTELVVVRGPNSEPTPIVCTYKDQPLDLDRWRAAVAEFPQLADPIHIPLAELPRTATLKTHRVELSCRLHEQTQEPA